MTVVVLRWAVGVPAVLSPCVLTAQARRPLRVVQQSHRLRCHANCPAYRDSFYSHPVRRAGDSGMKPPFGPVFLFGRLGHLAVELGQILVFLGRLPIVRRDLVAVEAEVRLDE